MHYPELILQCKFNPKFAVRGIQKKINKKKKKKYIYNESNDKLKYKNLSNSNIII